MIGIFFDSIESAQKMVSKNKTKASKRHNDGRTPIKMNPSHKTVADEMHLSPLNGDGANANEYDIALKILDNDLLFEEEFVKRQKDQLGSMIEAKDSGDFHAMPEANLKVAVVGAFSCGKSAFINSILDDAVAPSEITPLTHGVTSFIYGDKELYKANEALISREEYQKKVQGKDEAVKHFIIEYPCARLKEFEFIDSPGFASVSSGENQLAYDDTALSEEAVQRADVVFFLNNITEGVIQGDSLKRLHAIAKGINAENPHRRVYVVLTWADQKPPQARATIRESIIKLCEDERLPIDGVMLYCSLPEKAKLSDRDFFQSAKEQLFRTLGQLRQEGQELKQFRNELARHVNSLKKRITISRFVQACTMYLNYQTVVVQYQYEKQFEKNWRKFIKKIVRNASDFTLAKVKNEISIYSTTLTDHTFSDYQLKIDYDDLDLSEDDIATLADYFDSQISDGLSIPEDDASIRTFFEPENDDEDGLTVKQVFDKICREIIVLTFKPSFYAIQSEADASISDKLEEIYDAFEKNAPHLWEEYLTIVFKDRIHETTLSPVIAKIENQLENVKQQLAMLAADLRPSKKLNLNIAESKQNIYEILGL